MLKDVRGPNKRSKGVIVEGRNGSGMVCLVQHARAMYSFHLVGHVLHSSDNTSSIHAPTRSTLPWPLVTTVRGGLLATSPSAPRAVRLAAVAVSEEAEAAPGRGPDVALRWPLAGETAAEIPEEAEAATGPAPLLCWAGSQTCFSGSDDARLLEMALRLEACIYTWAVNVDEAHVY